MMRSFLAVAAPFMGWPTVGGQRNLCGHRPTKALLYAAEVMHLAGHAGPWGIQAKDFADYCRQQLAAQIN